MIDAQTVSDLVTIHLVILSEAKNLSWTKQSYNEILRFAQNDKATMD